MFLDMNETSENQPAIKINTNLYSIITFISAIVLLIAFYATLRLALNLTLYQKYPTTGILPFLTTYYSSTNESYCFYPQTYYDTDGKIREATAAEKTAEKTTQGQCLDGMKDSRDTAKTTDIGQATLLLFLGAGLFISRRFFF